MKVNMIKLIQKNFISKVSYFSNYDDKIKILENKDFLRVDSGLASDTFNVFVLKNNDIPEKTKILEENTGYYNRKNYATAFWIWNDKDRSILENMEEYGFQFVEQETAMFINSNKIKTEKSENKDFIVKQAASMKETEHFSEVLSSIFKESKEFFYVKKQYEILSKNKIYESSDIIFFIGYYKDIPVSCGSLYLTEESAGIYDIVTKKEYRNKGLGTLIFSHLLEAARQKEKEYCVLQASLAGAGIYKKMGFQEICKIDVYENAGLLGKARKEKMYYTYIVKCADDTYYTGYTNDLEKRILAHNERKGAKYTKNRNPVELVYFEEYKEKNKAMKREYAIKRLTRLQKEKLIKSKKCITEE